MTLNPRINRAPRTDSLTGGNDVPWVTPQTPRSRISVPHLPAVRISRVVDDGHHLVGLGGHQVPVEPQRGVLLALEGLVLVCHGPLELAVRLWHGSEVHGENLRGGGVVGRNVGDCSKRLGGYLRKRMTHGR